MKGQNKNDESRLLPIWALAAANLSEIDHTNNATRVSSNKHKNRESESYLQSSKNSSGVVGGGDEVTLRPLIIPSTNSDSKGTSPVASNTSPKPIDNVPSPSSPFGGSIQWVKSGNKWVMSDKGRAMSQRGKEANSGDTAYSFHSPPRSKAHPTAVSSFSTGHHLIPKFSETASVFGSIASSTSGLYSKSKMATTPNGFPYMPALYLTRNGSKLTTNTKSMVNSNNTSGPISGSTVGKSKIQRSYFVEGLGKGIKRIDKSEDDLRPTLSLFDESGYDSDGTRTERMKEWKEQFVQKYLSNTSSKASMKKSSSFAKSSSSLQSTRAKSFDSDYDSEVLTTNVRLKQWKEEQYRIHNISKRIDELTDSNHSRKDVPLIQMSISLPDTGYDSDSSRQQRLKEWKEQQLAQISNMKDQPTENTDSPIDIRRGKAIPDRGLFPATSPTRKSKMDEFEIKSDSPFQFLKVQKENTEDCLNSSFIGKSQTMQLPKEGSKKHTKKNIFSQNDNVVSNLIHSIVRPQEEFSIQHESNDSQKKRMIDLPYWDNCLYVKAEGARSGTIFLTQTYLVFVYDDEVTDELLSQYGWQRHEIVDLLLDMEEPSRSATPVNVPLGQTGEGEAVELIGSNTRTNFSVLLEDGFNFESTPCSMSSSFPTKQSSQESQIINGTMDQNEDSPSSFSSSMELDSSSHSNDQNIYVNKAQPMDDTKSGKQQLRAIHEESLYFDKAGSHDGPIYAPTNGLLLDSDAIHNNFTNLSSFTELDMDFIQDEENSMYITGDMDPKQKFAGIRWPLSKLGEVFERRYMMKDVAIEIFAPSSSSLTTKNLWTDLSDGLTEIDVPLGPLSNFSIYFAIPDTDDAAIPAFRRRTLPRRDHFVDILKQKSIKINDVHVRSLFTNSYKKWNWGRNPKNKALELLTRAWQDGHISNYNYLLRLNAISGRSFHDPGSYPIMPWVLSNYSSTSVPDLSDAENFRDLTKPMGALCPTRLQKFKEKYLSLCTSHHETSIPPFLYGSHYSNTGGVVLHYLVRVRPFAGLHRQLQGGKFDIPDRLFRSVSQTWDYCSKTSATEVKELTPEWYDDPEFLRNKHNFDFGCVASDGCAVEDVILPPWADNDPEKFVKVMRNALESDYCSKLLPCWIDLIFGYKQRGCEAEKADNLFYHLSYYDSDDLAQVEDEDLRTQIALHIADFGVCPNQLFFESHPLKHTQQKGELEIMIENAMMMNETQSLK